MFGKRKGSPLVNQTQKDPRTASPLQPDKMLSTPSLAPGSLTRTSSVMSFASADSVMEPTMGNENPGALNSEHISNFTTKIDGAFRNEITVEVQKINGKPFKGSITYKEAKYDLFQKGLQMDLGEFVSVTLGFKGVPVAIFKLANQVNIDDFASIQFFEYTRKYKVGSLVKEDVISCKIRGVRIRGAEPTSEDMGGYRDEGIRWVKVEGTDYRIKKEMILDWLTLWGQPMSDITEETFEEEATVGGSGTGIYSLKMKMDREIPQLLPMDGKRVKIFYRGIGKLCTNCFMPHNRTQCKNEKVLWIKYVEEFMKAHENIPSNYYGSWSDKIGQEKIKPKSFQDPREGSDQNKEAFQENVQEAGRDNDQTEEGKGAEDVDQELTDQLVIQVGAGLSLGPELEDGGEIKTKSKLTGAKPKQIQRKNSFSQEDEMEVENLMAAGFERSEAEGMQVFTRKRKEREQKAANKIPPDKIAPRRGRSTQ